MLREGTAVDGKKGGRKGAFLGFYGLYRIAGIAGILEELQFSRSIMVH